jgi:hypothetical protein
VANPDHRHSRFCKPSRQRAKKAWVMVNPIPFVPCRDLVLLLVWLWQRWKGG